MVFHGFPKPISMKHMDDQGEKKRTYKYDNMFFLVLDNEFIDELYNSKFKLNLPHETLLQSFMHVLERWIQNINLDAMMLEASFLIHTTSTLPAMNDINITNLLDFICFYKFCVKSNFHQFVQKLHEFCVIINMNDIIMCSIS